LGKDISYYTTSDLGHKQILKKMTKIHHFAFSDLRTNVNNKIAPMARADHSLWPETALPAVPTTLTSEQLQMFINKAKRHLVAQA